MPEVEGVIQVTPCELFEIRAMMQPWSYGRLIAYSRYLQCIVMSGADVIEVVRYAF